MSRIFLAALGLVVSAPAFAQATPEANEADVEALERSDAYPAGEDQRSAETCVPRTNGEGDKKSSLAKDAGGAAANTGGAIAGGAVAGPIGAAVGGVVADHAGRMVGKIFGGKKKPGNPAEDCRQQPAVAAAGSHAKSDQ
ncbi:hypothetical protein KRR38_33520 [Novosphingobium sp. G106]|uniref:hypothetical protein n=1 Tax=Novosphingobium sp. G106 TaxID=2849500 RepID=UPI001C2D97AD|nr:hypothetical protein [Novosphingobium sp. G106]MBV1692426.1 hypothetical protein [Novosphingobium sp. G106]